MAITIIEDEGISLFSSVVKLMDLEEIVVLAEFHLPIYAGSSTEEMQRQEEILTQRRDLGYFNEYSFGIGISKSKRQIKSYKIPPSSNEGHLFHDNVLNNPGYYSPLEQLPTNIILYENNVLTPCTKGKCNNKKDSYNINHNIIVCTLNKDLTYRAVIDKIISYRFYFSSVNKIFFLMS